MKFQREAAIAKSMDLFWRQGYSGTTPVELVDELGIGKGSLYHSFESKHNLFTIALRRYTTERLKDLDGLLGESGPMKPKLRTAIEQLAGVGAHERGCFLVNSMAELGGEDEAVTEIARGLFEGIELAFRTAIERAQASGEIDGKRDSEDLASSLLATVVGASILAKTGGNEARLSRIVGSAVELL
jgi:TetR/AcrR family transcriptional repressor of nem operon